MKNNKGKEWFRNAGFGMFIHWGLYSAYGHGEWAMWQEKIPPEQYGKLTKKFNAQNYCPETWANLAREAGMKYMVLTTRHHDGYCLFDTKTTDYNSCKTGPRADLVAEYVKAARKAGMKVGFYYSLGSWLNPLFLKNWNLSPKLSDDPKAWQEMVADVHEQIRELCSNYGKIDLLWYDGCFPPQNIPQAEAYDSENLNAMVRQLQPEIIINDRSGLPEDYDTPEQHIKASTPGRMWESCMTMNMHWGYYADDNVWKPARVLIHNLTACACGGGNYLLNVGPRADGSIPAASVQRLREMGDWLHINGEAIYGVERSTVHGASFGISTAKDDKTYLIIHWWPGKELRVPDLPVDFKHASILGDGHPVAFERKGNGVVFKGLPSRHPNPNASVIALEK